MKSFLFANVPLSVVHFILFVIFGGFQTFAIGIIGEYIAKTYLESKRRPMYCIREKI